MLYIFVVTTNLHFQVDREKSDDRRRFYMVLQLSDYQLFNHIAECLQQPSDLFLLRLQTGYTFFQNYFS